MNECPNCHVELKRDATSEYLNCPIPNCGFRIAFGTHQLMSSSAPPAQPAQTGLRTKHPATEVWPR